MLPSIPVQKTQNNLAKTSLILGLFSVVAAILFHFLLFLFSGTLNNTFLIVFVSTPIIIAITSIILGMISLGQIMTNNIFGKGKAITGIVLGCVTIVGLIIFLISLFSKI